MTDLGTEFGVEVDAIGRVDFTFFRVRSNAVFPQQPGLLAKTIRLTENSALCIAAGRRNR